MNLRTALLAVVAGSLGLLVADASRGAHEGPSSGQSPETARQAELINQVQVSYLDYLDAVGAVGYLESGGAARYEGRDLVAWTAIRDEQRRLLQGQLAMLDDETPATMKADPVDVFMTPDALATMRRTLAALESDDTTSGGREYRCKDAQRRNLDAPALRAALVSCYVEHGNHLRFENSEIDRGTALQLLHVVDEPERRRAIFEAFGPLWTALNGANQKDSPYRRMISLTVRETRTSGTEVDLAARAIGSDSATVERWLVRILEAWRDANPATPIEPWDVRYVHGAANRELHEKIPASALLPINRSFYADLGADLGALGVVYDLEPRPDKSPLAYSDFLRRGRLVDRTWQRPVARVLGTYPTGGLFSLNELVHENGHAVNVSAIRTEPAFMDWADTLFVEAFADVPAWSVHEPAWQRRYLGVAVDEPVSLRALFANVMLDVAWSLFELRMLGDPATDPNALWTQITHDYLRVVPHPELPWWAMRVQLAGSPGYMVNYGLGAVLTAEIRAKTASAIGPFDAGNRGWYGWLSETAVALGGAKRDTVTLMGAFLGRPVTPDALLTQIQRCGRPAPAGPAKTP